MQTFTRAQLAAKITTLQRLQGIMKLNTDVSFLLRCNLLDKNTARTVLYELKQCDTPFDLADAFNELLTESINVVMDQINKTPVL